MYLLLVGTKKGLFLYTSTDRQRWSLTGPHLRGKEVYHALRDQRTGRIFAASNDAWFGCEVMYSDDLGITWTSAARGPAFSGDSGLTLQNIWHFEPGRPEEPDVLYAGVAPAALFRTEDRGMTWTELKGLTGHPTRERWHPGAGGMCLHSIQLDPFDRRRLFVGISAVGVFRSDDGGETWQTSNRGTRAEFMPDKYPEYGQCVHKLLAAPAPPGAAPRLYQQNHCGVYRSDDSGASWTEITAGLPSDFGFPLALHPRDPDVAYVLPLQGGDFRCPPEGKLRVFRTRDAGGSWEPLSEGLPQDPTFSGVLREGMTWDAGEPSGVYFGTNTGKIFASRDEGDTWFLLGDNLPPVLSVSIASWE